MEAIKSLFVKTMQLPDETKKQDLYDLGIPAKLVSELMTLIEIQNLGRVCKWVASCYDPNSKDIKIEKNRYDLKMAMVARYGITTGMFISFESALILVDERERDKSLIEDAGQDFSEYTLEEPIEYFVKNYFPPVVRLVSWYLENSKSPLWSLIISAKECMVEFMEVARSRVVYSFIDPDKLMKAYSNKADCLSKAMMIQEKIGELEEKLRFSLKDIEEILENEFQTDYSNTSIVEDRIQRLNKKRNDKSK